ncbi:MAG: DEAD/DEAH box helicase family protein [Candidatus Methanomethylicaceae archaeon]|nr:DEAD/DEAH box helicase family protein [Candidatus Verstraetearchaeota archaeon]
MVLFVKLSYSKGTIIIDGDISTPYTQWDPRIKAYRAPAYFYKDIIKYLERNKIFFKDEVLKPPPSQPILGKVELYPFQKEAFERWIENGYWGTICIVTAGGKTFIGLKAIEVLRKSTIILAPTLALVDQWVERLKTILGIEPGILGGGKVDIKWITVSTYDSAYIRAEEIGDKFELLIADEAHHIFAPAYSQIAEMLVAPYRMGLTSTLHRSDMRHLDAPRLIGGIVYEASHEDLAGSYIAPYEHKRIYVDLTPEERMEYDRLWKIYTSFLEKRGIKIESNNDFQKLIVLSAKDPEAREAILARAKALKIALNSESKMKFLAEQLKLSNEKTIIFTLHNSLVYEISRRFLIPAITHETSEDERRIILEKFKSGDYKAIVTSLVLDEGIDVPDASRGIVLAGYGSPRQHIQRLGRLLRKKEGKKAILLEIISRETKDVDFSRRRRRNASKRTLSSN